MAWYPVLGHALFWGSLVLGIVLFIRKRKWFPILYLASIAFYAFTVGFVIDVFDVTREIVLLLLAFSSALMMGLGYYLSREKSRKRK